MKALILTLLAWLSFGTGLAQAAPSTAKVKVVNFTATWCPSCRIFDPRLEKALKELNDPEIAHIPIDLTVTRTGTMDDRVMFWGNLLQNMTNMGIGDLHEGFMGFPNTGYAVIIAADTQEPLFCTMGPVDVQYLKDSLKAAKTRVEFRPPNERVPEGADCPPSYQ